MAKYYPEGRDVGKRKRHPAGRILVIKKPNQSTAEICQRAVQRTGIVGRQPREKPLKRRNARDSAAQWPSAWTGRAAGGTLKEENNETNPPRGRVLYGTVYDTRGTEETWWKYGKQRRIHRLLWRPRDDHRHHRRSLGDRQDSRPSGLAHQSSTPCFFAGMRSLSDGLMPPETRFHPGHSLSRQSSRISNLPHPKPLGFKLLSLGQLFGNHHAL